MPESNKKPPSSETRVRVVLYARVSKNEGQHTENQSEKLRDFVSHQTGWVLIDEYIDQASGGSTDNRPEFLRMMADATRAKYDQVVFWSLDRLTREGARKTLEYLGRWDHYKIGYRSLMEPYLDTTGPFRDVLISIMGALAQQERARMRERISAGMSRARGQGKTMGRKRQVWDASKLAAMAKTHSLSQIATLTGISKATASRRIRDYRESQGENG